MNDSDLERRVADGLRALYEPKSGELDLMSKLDRRRPPTRSNSLILSGIAGVLVVVGVAAGITVVLHRHGASPHATGGDSHSLTSAELALATNLAHEAANELANVDPATAVSWPAAVKGVTANAENREEAAQAGYVRAPGSCNSSRLLLIRMLATFDIDHPGLSNPNPTGTAPAQKDTLPDAEEVIGLTVDPTSASICSRFSAPFQIPDLPGNTVIYQA